jgi:lysophospholipase L1-like esterase
MFNLYFLVGYQVTGYVKPNAGLTELLNSAKEETGKLTKKDTVIVLGGTNDIERNLHGKNLTSIVKFLDATQHTNVMLTDVPRRYDPGKRPHINEETVNYNRKLHKVTKSFKHAKLTSRE